MRVSLLLCVALLFGVASCFDITPFGGERARAVPAAAQQGAHFRFSELHRASVGHRHSGHGVPPSLDHRFQHRPVSKDTQMRFAEQRRVASYGQSFSSQGARAYLAAVKHAVPEMGPFGEPLDRPATPSQHSFQPQAVSHTDMNNHFVAPNFAEVAAQLKAIQSIPSKETSVHRGMISHRVVAQPGMAPPMAPPPVPTNHMSISRPQFVHHAQAPREPVMLESKAHAATHVSTTASTLAKHWAISAKPVIQRVATPPTAAAVGVEGLQNRRVVSLPPLAMPTDNSPTAFGQGW